MDEGDNLFDRNDYINSDFILLSQNHLMHCALWTHYPHYSVYFSLITSLCYESPNYSAFKILATKLCATSLTKNSSPLLLC